MRKLLASIWLVVTSWLAQPADSDLPEGWLPARLLQSTKAKALAEVGAVASGVLGNVLYSKM